MKRFTGLAAFAAGLIVCAIAATCAAQSDAPIGRDVDVEAVIRTGNCVQRLGTFGDDDPATNSYVAEMAAVPPDDNQKWFVTVVGASNCPACEQLLKRWPTDQYLLALAHPSDPRNSWAHFNYYRVDDRLQAWRFRSLDVRVFPTIIVQPPLKGRGDPSTVVYQAPYRGDSAATVTSIGSAVRAYLETLAPKLGGVDEPSPTSATAAADDERPGVEPVSIGWGQAPAVSADDWSFPRLIRPNRPATPQATPFDTPLTPSPNVSPVVTPSPTPSNPLDGLIIPPPLNPTPTPAPSVTPSPSTPATPSTPAPAVEPVRVNDVTPEAVLVTDADGDPAVNDSGELLQRVERLKSKLGGKIRTRTLDWVDAKDRLPMLSRDELPAVVFTQNGRIVDKISARLLPLVTTTAAGWLGLEGFPVDAVVSFFTSGFTWAAALALVVWFVYWLRARRAANGQPPLVNDSTLSAIVAAVTAAVSKLTPTKQPATPTETPAK